MLIDLGEEPKITVKVGAQSYELREPKLDDIKALKDAGDSEDSFLDFVINLGLPEDIAKNLGVFRLKKLSDGLTGVLSEKK